MCSGTITSALISGKQKRIGMESGRDVHNRDGPTMELRAANITKVSIGNRESSTEIDSRTETIPDRAIRMNVVIMDKL